MNFHHTYPAIGPGLSALILIQVEVFVMYLQVMGNAGDGLVILYAVCYISQLKTCMSCSVMYNLRN
jgi:hypothetical protein